MDILRLVSIGIKICLDNSLHLSFQNGTQLESLININKSV